MINSSYISLICMYTIQQPKSQTLVIYVMTGIREESAAVKLCHVAPSVMLWTLGVEFCLHCFFFFSSLFLCFLRVAVNTRVSIAGNDYTSSRCHHRRRRRRRYRLQCSFIQERTIIPLVLWHLAAATTASMTIRLV